VDFAITNGVHTHEDLLKAMMAGANVAMLATESTKTVETYAGLTPSWIVEVDAYPRKTVKIRCTDRVSPSPGRRR
jgi:hypothetical protein